MTFAVTLVGSGADRPAAQTFSVTLSGSVPQGRHVIVSLAARMATGVDPTVTDSQGQTYTLIQNSGGGGSSRTSFYIKEASAALSTSDTVTADCGAANTFTSISMQAVSVDGALPSSPLDSNTTNSNNSVTTTTTPTVSSASAPSVAGEQFVAMVAAAGPIGDTFTEDTGNGWSQINRVGSTGGVQATNSTHNLAQQVNAAATSLTYAPTFGTARAFGALIISLKPSVFQAAWTRNANTAASSGARAA